MAVYLVENEDAPINSWGCYWLVKADSAKEAIDNVYFEENYYYVDNCDNRRPSNVDLARAARETGIMKRKLTATKINNMLFGNEKIYRIQ